MVILNKIDLVDTNRLNEVSEYFSSRPYCKKLISISAASGINRKKFISSLLEFIPEGPAYFEGDDISDLQTRFFVGELVREKIYEMAQDEIPYQTTVQVREYKEKESLVKITADIIVQRETQKVILIGQKGSMIKRIGTEARKSIEAFIGQKVFLELFVKVKPNWRENELQLKDLGY